MSRSRLSFPVFVLIVSFASSAGRAEGVSGSRPNVVFMLADDMGWAQPGFNGGQAELTPNMDRLAEEPESPPDQESATHLLQAAPARLQILTGAFAGRELELKKPLTTLGRPGVQVVAVTRRGDSYTVVNMQRGNGKGTPLVNGEPLGPSAQPLHDNDVLEVAGVKMGFFAG